MGVAHKLQLVLTDICGPLQTPSFGNYVYFMTFIDDSSKHAWIYPLKVKFEVLICFTSFLVMAKICLHVKWVPSILIKGGNTCIWFLMHF